MTYNAIVSGQSVLVLTVACHRRTFTIRVSLLDFQENCEVLSQKPALYLSLLGELLHVAGRQAGRACYKDSKKTGLHPLASLPNPQERLENSACLVPWANPEHNSKGRKEQCYFFFSSLNASHSTARWESLEKTAHLPHHVGKNSHSPQEAETRSVPSSQVQLPGPTAPSLALARTQKLPVAL